MEWSESISKAIDYIESHITEELTIADIAEYAIISPYYFQKGFSMLCGTGMIRRIVLQKHFFVFMVPLLLPYAKERE